jgi:hypothetical protein
LLLLGSSINEIFEANKKLNPQNTLVVEKFNYEVERRKKQFLESAEETENIFSRKELLNFCDPNKQIIESNQVEANVIFFRAGKISRAFFSEVLHVATFDNYFFMRDTRNCINQRPKPDLYRYDQSIYSLLYKKWNFKLIKIPNMTNAFS